MKRLLQNLLRHFGYELKRYPSSYDPGTENDFKDIVKGIEGIHGQTWERLYALYGAVKYIHRYKIPGAIVECGVYKGASAIVAAETLKNLGDTTRKIYLYDTFEGMSAPTQRDIQVGSNRTASDFLKGYGYKHWSEWIRAPLEEVKERMARTGYPAENFVYIKGKVEETLPQQSPDQIALLRLDTDWYESTYHEMVHLYPKLAIHGILLLDDYGHWKGAREAVDRYLSENRVRIHLQRADYTGYIGVKTQS